MGDQSFCRQLESTLLRGWSKQTDAHTWAMLSASVWRGISQPPNYVLEHKLTAQLDLYCSPDLLFLPVPRNSGDRESESLNESRYVSDQCKQASEGSYSIRFVAVETAPFMAICACCKLYLLTNIAI